MLKVGEILVGDRDFSDDLLGRGALGPLRIEDGETGRIGGAVEKLQVERVDGDPFQFRAAQQGLDNAVTAYAACKLPAEIGVRGRVDRPMQKILVELAEKLVAVAAADLLVELTRGKDFGL